MWNSFGFYIWRSLKASVFLHCAGVWKSRSSWWFVVFWLFWCCLPLNCAQYWGSWLFSMLHGIYLCVDLLWMNALLFSSVSVPHFTHHLRQPILLSSGEKDWSLATEPSVVKCNIPEKKPAFTVNKWLCSHWPAQWFPFYKNWILENFSTTSWKRHTTSFFFFFTTPTTYEHYIVSYSMETF